MHNTVEINNKHCVIVRDETEWVELVDNGFAKVVGSIPSKILEAFHQFNNSSIDFIIDLYGDHVGEKIYQSILNLIKE